ncbi:MAG: hypothetical protein RL341_190, partial [Pseudomonadota bacterium]
MELGLARHALSSRRLYNHASPTESSPPMPRTTLTQALIEEQRIHNTIPGELRLLIEVVARACKRISVAVGKGALGDILGAAGTDNVQ